MADWLGIQKTITYILTLALQVMEVFGLGVVAAILGFPIVTDIMYAIATVLPSIGTLAFVPTEGEMCIITLCLVILCHISARDMYEIHCGICDQIEERNSLLSPIPA